MSDQYSDTPNGQKSGSDLFEPAYHPGRQTEEQANNPWDPDLYPPDWSLDPIGFAEWKKTQSYLVTPSG
jgi:hypothetical protein